MKTDINEMFLAHGGELRRYLTRQLRCPQTAADLLQDVFLNLAVQGSGLRIDNARSYLFQTARNLLIDHARKEERRRTVPAAVDQLDGYADSRPTVEQAVAARQKIAILAEAISELPALTQRIFELNRLHGLTYDAVAQQLGVSESSVQKHLARALLHAMERLKGV